MTKDEIDEMVRLARSVRDGKPVRPYSFVEAGQVLAGFVLDMHDLPRFAKGDPVTIVDGIHRDLEGVIISRHAATSELGVPIWLVDVTGVRSTMIREDFLDLQPKVEPDASLANDGSAHPEDRSCLGRERDPEERSDRAGCLDQSVALADRRRGESLERVAPKVWVTSSATGEGTYSEQRTHSNLDHITRLVRAAKRVVENQIDASELAAALQAFPE